MFFFLNVICIQKIDNSTGKSEVSTIRCSVLPVQKPFGRRVVLVFCYGTGVVLNSVLCQSCERLVMKGGMFSAVQLMTAYIILVRDFVLGLVRRLAGSKRRENSEYARVFLLKLRNRS
jgi:hypothetical protein